MSQQSKNLLSTVYQSSFITGWIRHHSFTYDKNFLSCLDVVHLSLCMYWTNMYHTVLSNAILQRAKLKVENFKYTVCRLIQENILIFAGCILLTVGFLLLTAVSYLSLRKESGCHCLQKISQMYI